MLPESEDRERCYPSIGPVAVTHHDGPLYGSATGRPAEEPEGEDEAEDSPTE